MKIDLRFWNVWTLVLIFGVVYLPGDVLAESEEIPFHRTATAIRMSGPPPRLDGVLDDEIWKIAPLHEGFRQRDPDEGKPATERTTFQIAYDDEAFYFGIMCYDSEPDKIVAQLIRRDNVFVDSDKMYSLIQIKSTLTLGSVYI